MAFLAAVFLSVLFAWENPLWQDLFADDPKQGFFADPTARVWPDDPDTLYVYPSHDVYPARGCDLMDLYHVFSTQDENMEKWTDHGIIVQATDTTTNGQTWGRPEGGFMWAPDAVFYNGTYYFYFPHPSGSDWGSTWKIGVATSKNPASGFKVVGYIPDVPSLIDPCVFIDDDGTPYLFIGGGNHAMYGKLNTDMVSLAEPMQDIQGLEDFHEATFVFKKGDIYYFTYSDNHEDGRDGVAGDNRLRYATSNSVRGPWENRGIYMNPTDSYVNHGSIVQFKGRWFQFYLNSALSLKVGEFNDWTRSVCVDEVFFNEDGTIQIVKQTGFDAK
uniref:Putative glycosyl hydrolase family43 n=1 Tax=uncultured symbiotic protist of Reticulitermes speratus TaxID=403658 RepID=A4UWR0_9EUKA|nr:putative glycosyl hydrolase family43 [uncultured symbiotic protist of Reticulitermes speratus]BAF57321.1 putative glycosyl hydrolase family43 [uncultured symbiotic protist of Reticulitermes speratus]